MFSNNLIISSKETIHKKELIIIEEKFKLNEILLSKSYSIHVNRSDYIPQNKVARSYLHRNLVDDTYNLEIATYNNKWNVENPYVPYFLVNSNEKYLFSGMKDNKIYAFDRSEYKKDFRYRVHRTLFDNLPFRKTFSLVFGVDFFNQSPYLHYIFTPEFTTLPRYANLKTNQILLLRSLKSIEIALPDHIDKSFFNYNNRLQKTKPKIKLHYNEIYLVPESINQWNGNKTLLKIYIRNQNGKSYDHDYDFSQGILKTSSINKNLTTNFNNRNYENNLETKDFGYGKCDFLGTIDINESTYYDYHTKKVIEGFSDKSIVGETIPYNFKGLFKRELMMNFNSVFKNFTIRLMENIEKPLLDIDEGQAQLSIKEQGSHGNYKEHLITQWSINYKNILLLRQRIRNNNLHFMSLQGLKNLSNIIKNESVKYHDQKVKKVHFFV